MFINSLGTSGVAAAVWAAAARTLTYPPNPTIGQSSGVADVSAVVGNAAKGVGHN